MQAPARAQATGSANRHPSYTVSCTFLPPTTTSLCLRHQAVLLNGTAPRQLPTSSQRLLAARYRRADELPLPPQIASGPILLPEPGPEPVNQPQTAPPPIPPLQARAQLKVIGLGQRGISAVNRLIGSGSLQPDAEFWALDSDKRVLAGADPSARVLEVVAGDDTALPPADLAALAGEGATVPTPPEAPDGHAGAVFVLGSAFGSPGGAPMLVQLVRHLRRCGYFVSAALTRPFDFEGPRRLEAADTLISTLQEVAHLVVVIAQGVLIRASAELTMSQAQAIADTTLIHTVQSTLWALRSPEVLMVCNGTFLWHGRDLRNFRRPLFPPMMSLLSCPGHATLGRGQASLPLPLLQQAGLASALSTLAEDAVKAASESPFLDNKLESATGVLCVVRVPPSALGVMSERGSGCEVGAGSGLESNGGSSSGSSGFSHQGGPLVADNHKEYALRSAVQVAAMTVRELVGPHCRDVIVCPQLCPELEDVEAAADTNPARDNTPNKTSHSSTHGTAPQAPADSSAAAVRDDSAVSAEGHMVPLLHQHQQQSAVLGEGECYPPSNLAPVQLVRLEVSLLVLEAIEEAAEAKVIVGYTQNNTPAAAATHHKQISTSTSYAFTPTNPGAASATAVSNTMAAVDTNAAATARNRISASIGSRPAQPRGRRLPPPTAPAPASSLFSGQLTTGTGPSRSTSPLPQQQQRRVSPSMPRSQSPRSLSPRPSSSSSVSSAVAPPRVGSAEGGGADTGLFTGRIRAPNTAAADSSSTTTTNTNTNNNNGTVGNVIRRGPSTPRSVASPASSAVAAAAESNRLRMQERLAAMALAGGASGPGGLAGGGMGGVQDGTHGSGSGSGASVAPGSGWRSGSWGAGFRQQHAQTAQTQPHTTAVEGVADDARGTRGGRGGGGMAGADAGDPGGSLQQIPRIAENLVTSLVAQSLDLPPQAARWRHMKRSPPPDRSASSYVFTMPRMDGELTLSDEDGAWPEEGAAETQQGDDGLGRGLQRFIMGMRLPGRGPDGATGGAEGGGTMTVRSRVAGMLDIERKEMWGSEGRLCRL